MTDYYGKEYKISVAPSAADSMIIIVGETEFHLHMNGGLALAEAIAECGVKMAKIAEDNDRAHILQAANAHLKYITQVRESNQ